MNEEKLVKALSELEEVVEKGDPKGKMPKSTDEANGGLSTEGDKSEMATTGSVTKAVKGKKKTLTQWAKEEEEEEAHKAVAADEDSEDEESDEESESEESEDETSKSTISDIMKSDTASGPVLDVAPFLETLVDTVSEADMELRKALVELHEEQSEFNSALRKAVVGIGNLVLEMKEDMADVMNRPAGTRKSVLSKSDVIERFEEETPSFSKSQVLDTMIDLVQKGQIDALSPTIYETSNFMDPTVKDKVETALRKSLGQ